MIYCERIFSTEYEGGKHFFNLVKEGDTLTFATEDDSERTLWVQAVYRATGQTHKPTPPVQQTNKISNTQISRMQGGGCLEGGGGGSHCPMSLFHCHKSILGARVVCGARTTRQ